MKIRMTKPEIRVKPEARMTKSADAFFGFRHSSFIRISGFVILTSLPAAVLAQDKVTYTDHVLPIFRNNCLNCHNPDKKKADLDLSTFPTAMAGGGSGKVLEPGNPEGSLLYRLVTHAEEPNMPPKGGKLAEKDLNTIKA